MEFITDINPAVAIALGTFIMGVVQALKPFIADRFVIAVVFVFSAVIGAILAIGSAAGGVHWALTAVQAFIYTGLLVGTSTGAYAVAKAVKKENPAGL